MYPLEQALEERGEHLRTLREPFMPPRNHHHTIDEFAPGLLLEHHGCAYYAGLVAAGPERGTVWKYIELEPGWIPECEAGFQTMGNLHLLSAEFLRKAGTNLDDAARLFLHQDDGLIWNAIPGYGILFPLSPFLALVELAVLAEKAVRWPRSPAFPSSPGAWRPSS